MSKSSFWGTVTCLGAYLYSTGIRHENLLESIDCEQCHLLISQASTEFASAKTNPIEKYGDDWKKHEDEWTGEVEIGKQEIMALTKHTWLYSDLLCAFKGKRTSALGF